MQVVAVFMVTSATASLRKVKNAKEENFCQMWQSSISIILEKILASSFWMKWYWRLVLNRSKWLLSLILYSLVFRHKIENLTNTFHTFGDSYPRKAVKILCNLLHMGNSRACGIKKFFPLRLKGTGTWPVDFEGPLKKSRRQHYHFLSYLVCQSSAR